MGPTRLLVYVLASSHGTSLPGHRRMLSPVFGDGFSSYIIQAILPVPPGVTKRTHFSIAVLSSYAVKIRFIHRVVSRLGWIEVL
jgi:hypothetical protein